MKKFLLMILTILLLSLTTFTGCDAGGGNPNEGPGGSGGSGSDIGTGGGGSGGGGDGGSGGSGGGDNTTPTPTADDFNISGTETFVYDGTPKTVTITAKVQNNGTISVKYNGSAAAPSAVGTYYVTFDVAAAAGWNAASGLYAGTLSIITGEVLDGDDDDGDDIGSASSWTMVTNNTFGTARISSIAAKGERFVAVGYDGSADPGDFNPSNFSSKIAYSDDGVSWTAANIAPFTNEGISAVASNEDRFVAVGFRQQNNRRYGKMAYSNDGVTWNLITVSSFVADDYVTSIASNGKRFVLGTFKGKRAYSDDGITWTVITGSGSFDAITWNGSKFVATVSNGSILSSTDGVTWTSGKGLSGTYYLYALGCNQTSFVAFDFYYTNPRRMVYSNDGATWAYITHDLGQVNAVTSNGNRFVAVGWYIHYSDDNGMTWTTVTGSAGGASPLQTIAWNGSRFVAAGDNGRMAYSDNGAGSFGGSIPNIPSGVVASSASASSIAISWNPAAGAAYYKVYYSFNSYGSTKTFAGTTAGVSVIHSGLNSNTTYYYFITAVNEYGESLYSTAVSGRTSSITGGGGGGGSVVSGKLAVSGFPYAASSVIDIRAITGNPSSSSVYLSSYAPYSAGSGIMASAGEISWGASAPANGTYTIVLARLQSGVLSYYKATNVSLSNGAGSVSWSSFSTLP